MFVVLRRAGSVSAARLVVSIAAVCLAGVVALCWVSSAWAAAGAVVPSDPTALGGPALGADIASERTVFTRTYRRADGSKLLRAFTTPVNFRDASGKLQQIDTTLRAGAAGALVNRAGGGSLQLPKTLADPVVVGDAEQWVSFALAGAAGALLAVDGSAANYRDALPGVDAGYQALGDGVKETLSLTSRSAASSFRFALRHSAGLTPVLRGSGEVELRDAQGESVFVVPAPTVQEAGQRAPTSSHVAYALSADKATLTVEVDPEWLGSAALPVKVDPSVHFGTQTACNLVSGDQAGVSACGGSTLQVGFDGTHLKRAAFQFPGLQSRLAPTSIISARLAVGMVGQTNTSAAPFVKVTGLGHQLASGATWNTYNGVNAWSTPGGDVPAAASDRVATQTSRLLNSYAGGFVSFDISALAERWTRSDADNLGFELSAVDETAGNVVSLVGPGSVGGNTPSIEVVFRDLAGSQGDQTYETIPVTDRSQITVNQAKGSYKLDTKQFDLPGVNGFDLSLGLTWNNETLGADAGFGTAWTPNINGAQTTLDYTWYDGTKVLYADGGAVYRFDRDSANDVGATEHYVTPPGIEADMTYDGSADQTAITFRKTGVKWIYANSDGYEQRLIEIRGPHADLAGTSNVDRIRFSYRTDDPHKVDHITDTFGRQLAFHYDVNLALDKITDASGRHWDYTHTQQTAAAGYSFDRLDAITDPDGKTLSFTYPAASSDNYDKLSRVTDPRGNPVDLIAAGDGRAGQIIRRGATTATDVTWNFDRQPAAGVGHACAGTGLTRSVETDPRGYVSTFCANTRGQIVEAYDQKNRKTTNTYNARANVTNFTGLAGTANPAASTFSYNSTTGNQTGGTQPAGEQFSIGYCGDSGQATCSSSDTLSQYRPTVSTDPQGTKTLFGYTTGTGDLTTVRDGQSPARSQATFTYNPDGTVATSVQAVAVGSRTGSTPNTVTSATTSYNYDASHQLTSVVYPSDPNATGGKLRGDDVFTYDSLSRVKTAKDGRGTIQTFTYDGEDRTTRIDYSDGSWITFAYDANGNTTGRSDSAAKTSSYTYDRLNRRLTEAFPGSVNNSYTYDNNGNIKTLTDAAGTTTYSYDEINRVSSIVAPTATTGTDTVSYAYSDNSGVADGPYQQLITFPGGMKQESDSNLSGNLTSQIIKNPSGTALKSLLYAYKTGTNPQRALVQSLKDVQAGTTTLYTYSNTTEDVGHLIRARTQNTSSSALVEQYDYDYDPAGNRTSKRHTNSSNTVDATATYAYNQANQLCWTAPNPVADVATGVKAGCYSYAANATPTGGTLYSTDLAGNQTTGGTGIGTLAYDSHNRLSSIAGTSLSSLTAGNGELVGFGTTSYANTLLGLDRQIPSSGSATSYTRSPNGTAIAQRTTTAKQFLFTDRLGSTIGVADSGGSTLVKSYSYDPDGNSTTTGTGTATDLRFAGGHTLPSGLIHYGARYYNPTQARWTQPDPLRQLGDLTQGDSYSYAGGNAINYTDLTGTNIFGDALETIGAVAGTALTCGTAASGVTAGACVAGLVVVSGSVANLSDEIAKERDR